MNAYRRFGYVGYGAAALQTFVWGALEGWPPSMAPLLSLSSAVSFLLAVKLTYLLFGVERIVFLEKLLAVMLGAYLTAKVAGLPLGRSLDVVVLGVGTFLVFGRLGCASVGCCHGRPSRLGVVYGARKESLHPLWHGLRLFPWPLLESALSLALVVLAFLHGGAGWIYLLGYGLFRFPLEFVRGDLRPELWGASEAQWLSTLIAWGVWFATSRPAALVVALLLTAGLLVLVMANERVKASRWALGSASHVLSLARSLETPSLGPCETSHGILVTRGNGHLNVTRLGVPLPHRHADVLAFWIGRTLQVRLGDPVAKGATYLLPISEPGTDPRESSTVKRSAAGG